jgi:hypothetical protein
MGIHKKDPAVFQPDKVPFPVPRIIFRGIQGQYGTGFSREMIGFLLFLSAGTGNKKKGKQQQGPQVPARWQYDLLHGTV